MKTITVLCCVLSLFVISGSGLDNGLGRLPQMAWNSWNAIGCNINETLIMNMAKALVKTGLANAGYKYLNMDDCWAATRNASGYVQADPKDFPSGIKAVADFVHNLGLKFGIYSDAGSKTCGGRPGSLGYEVEDATQYAAWGVDYLKYDNCYNENIEDEKRYVPMRDALNKTGRPIFFSLCDWTVTTAVWGPKTGNSWRTTIDIQNFWESWTANLDQSNAVAAYAGPGGWNDPDMLEVGNGLSADENRAHFSLWALVKAPLILGNNLLTITNDILDILTNKDVIAVSQDKLGKQGFRIVHDISMDPKIYSNVLYADDCKSLPSQKWQYNASSNTISSRYISGQCVGWATPTWGCNMGPAPSGQLYLQPCGVTCKGATQKFAIKDGVFAGVYGNTTNNCVEIINANGHQEVQQGWTCTGDQNQKWVVQADGTLETKGGKCLTVGGGKEVWAGPLADGAQAVVLFNRAEVAQKITVMWSNIGFSGTAYVRDLWAGADLGGFSDGYSASVNAHGAVMLKISQSKL